MSPTQQIVEILFCILLELCRYNFALNLSSVILLSDPKNRNVEPLISYPILLQMYVWLSIILNLC